MDGWLLLLIPVPTKLRELVTIQFALYPSNRTEYGLISFPWVRGSTTDSSLHRKLQAEAAHVSSVQDGPMLGAWSLVLQFSWELVVPHPSALEERHMRLINRILLIDTFYTEHCCLILTRKVSVDTHNLEGSMVQLLLEYLHVRELLDLRLKLARHQVDVLVRHCLECIDVHVRRYWSDAPQ